MKNILGVVIQTYNESHNIEDCIKSAKKLSDNIIVVDTESTDDTPQKAKHLGIAVKTFPFSRYVEPARTFGIQESDAQWVLILDADERLSDELVHEIKNKITASSDTYYRIPRLNMFAGSIVLKHGGWYPDSQIRLIKKTAFKDWPARIHSTPIVEGSCGILTSPILHFFHGDISRMVEKSIIFEDIESDLLYKADKPVSTKTFMRKFLGELYRRLIRKQGFRDGTVGIIESMYQAFSKTITYLYLYEKKQSTTR